MHEDLRVLGETEAEVVEAVVKPFRNKVYTRFSPNEVEDVFQELRLAVWNAVTRYAPRLAGGQPDKYLRRTAFLRLLDLSGGRRNLKGLRLQVGRQRVEVGGPVVEEDEEAISLADWAESLLVAPDSPHEEVLVAAFLDQLPDRTRAMVEARLDRESWAGVAEAHGCSSNNVIQILRRAYHRWAA